ncbi:MAG TPA: 2-amino-4-hydroxy-6-hydroxymethyldihydropteridine diphosphokinase [Planctomycetota bacterium]|jgi:2-amino-4-hydroxy-6-hydroxymethyldihydropteridine diphosphokinase
MAETFNHNVFIALGANLGQREATLRDALVRLGRCEGISVERVSSFIETDPVGGEAGQPMYINAAAQLRTSLNPRELLHVLLEIERQLGRIRPMGQRNAARTIDLDLLLYDDLIVREPDLEIPHPRLHERRFVLVPLCELAPELSHPVLGKSMRELLLALAS